MAFPSVLKPEACSSSSFSLKFLLVTAFFINALQSSSLYPTGMMLFLVRIAR